jgi:DnaJ-class molecular chaperone
MSNRDKQSWDASKKTTPKPEPSEHSLPCSGCGGHGWVWQATLNRDTGSVEPCQTVCPSCGGSGTQ